MCPGQPLGAVPGRPRARILRRVTVPRTWVVTDRRYLQQRMPAALVAWLHARGHPVELVVADARPSLAAACAGDVVVGRSRHPEALRLLAEAQARGAVLLDAPDRIEAVRDKLRCARLLARAGLPVPATVLVHEPRDLRRLPPAAFPLVLKPVHGDNARGVRVLRSPEVGPWGGEPHLAQAYVEAGGTELKLYLAGREMWATRRPSPLVDPHAQGRRVALTPRLRALAARCRAAFGLTLLGLDVLESDAGPTIVDVNEFPNFTGVDEAPAAIGRLVLDLTRKNPAFGARAA